MTRSCGSCTKCCEGYLTGSVFGKTFYEGKPCHYLSINEKCTIYSKRPENPCATYKCEWLSNLEIPEWFKPNEINAIISERTLPNTNIKFLDLREAGETLQANVLSWLFIHVLENNLNLRWQVNGGINWIGSTEFIKKMEETK